MSGWKAASDTLPSHWIRTLPEAIGVPLSSRFLGIGESSGVRRDPTEFRNVLKGSRLSRSRGSPASANWQSRRAARRRERTGCRRSNFNRPDRRRLRVRRASSLAAIVAPASRACGAAEDRTFGRQARRILFENRAPRRGTDRDKQTASPRLNRVHLHARLVPYSFRDYRCAVTLISENARTRSDEIAAARRYLANPVVLIVFIEGAIRKAGRGATCKNLPCR